MTMPDFEEIFLETRIGNVMLVPALAKKLESEKQQSEIGSWLYTFQQYDSANDPADGFFFSVVVNDKQLDVQLHDGNHRIIALYYAQPELKIRDIASRIKFVHKWQLTDEDVEQLQWRDHEVSFVSSLPVITYWFPPEAFPNKYPSTVKDPGHCYRQIEVVSKETAFPLNFRKLFPSTLTVADFCRGHSAPEPRRPQRVIHMIVKPKCVKSDFTHVAGDFTRWKYKPLLIPSNGKLQIENLRPGERYEYKFVSADLKCWCNADGEDGVNSSFVAH